MNFQNEIAALMRERFATYPPILQITSVAEILEEDVPTIRARIRRGTFPITVRQETGGRQYVLLVDLVCFFCSGEIQPQPEMRPARKVRNPGGINGKRRRGAPSKAERVRTVLARGIERTPAGKSYDLTRKERGERSESQNHKPSKSKTEVEKKTGRELLRKMKEALRK